ncbi:MAG: 50S ribosomal protein L3 [Phycisphaerae bacterium]|jgi:large subunit ribosomal protein L3|nr:50S ribosomal protein L3 [Opitutales bacterium]MBT4583890.1 50S ribosomal protein L3 [Phycisphaerae bacterium]HJN71080.1 50S ribosomal protein L3 [Phycisphaerales bacterium]|tara:strand:+ start:2180 stop:2851 length:672 start_codon:yes stop_codon:yes gene_type:complete
MSKALLGKKIGMSRYFLEDGTNVPVTIVEAGPCVITQIKSEETDGYNAIQIGYEDVKPSRATMPIIGHDAKAGTAPKRFHNECTMENVDDVELGQLLDVSIFEDVKYVDIIGTSKGKGFQGGMKRHNFKGLEASHGVKRAHRRPGSINGHATNLGTGPKPKKGKRMPGHMGNKRITCRSIEIINIDTDRNLLVVKGAIPGANQGMVIIQQAKRLNRKKTAAVS